MTDRITPTPLPPMTPLVAESAGPAAVNTSRRNWADETIAFVSRYNTLASQTFQNATHAFEQAALSNTRATAASDSAGSAASSATAAATSAQLAADNASSVDPELLVHWADQATAQDLVDGTPSKWIDAALGKVMLDGKANTAHTHTIANVTGLQAALDGKSNTGHTHTAVAISDSTTVGRAVLTAANETSARAAIGAGTSSLALGSTDTTAKAGNWLPAVAEVQGIGTAASRNIGTAGNAVPLLNTANTWSEAQTLSKGLSSNGNLNVTGAVIATGDVSSGSDSRWKENLRRVSHAMAKVQKLSGYTYNRVGMDTREVGLIAQEVKAILPEAVVSDPAGYLHLNYGNMAALLVEALKELDARLSKGGL